MQINDKSGAWLQPIFTTLSDFIRLNGARETGELEKNEG